MSPKRPPIAGTGRYGTTVDFSFWNLRDSSQLASDYSSSRRCDCIGSDLHVICSFCNSQLAAPLELAAFGFSQCPALRPRFLAPEIPSHSIDAHSMLRSCTQAAKSASHIMKRIGGKKVYSVGFFFPRRKKGLFEQVQARKPSPSNPSAILTDAQHMNAHKWRLYLAWKQSLRPFSLALVGLAIAVALWGYGYKLSLYHPQPTPTLRASVAKLWVGPRNPRLAAASKLNTQLHRVFDSQCLPAPSLPFQLPNHTDVLVFPLRIGSATYSNSLIPSRSPPPNRFRLT